jgi:DNA (cytosine-5)-methyltransferase 1
MLTNFIQYMHSKVMQHRNHKRLWIQGAKPLHAGFVIGAKYDVIERGNNIEIRLSQSGKYTVTRKEVAGKFVPVMDARLPSEHSLQVDDRVRVVFSDGIISVSLHHELQAKMEREKQFIEGVRSGALREGSLCTGGGISTAATFEAIRDAGLTGSKLAYVVDESLSYLQVAGANNFAVTDETKFIVSRLEEVEPEYIGKLDVLSFSLPCAGLSRAGAAKHKLSPEEHSSAPSVFGLRTFIKKANPAVLWSENVREAKDSPLYILLKAELVRLGYRIVEDVTANEKTGSLEKRTRYWFMAVSDGLDASLDRDIFNYQMSLSHSNLNAIRDMDADSTESNWADNDYLKAKQVRDAADGKGFAKRQLMTGEEQSVGTIGRFYAKRRSTECFWVRDTDDKERLFSPKEHAAVKQIPYGLVSNISNTMAHEIMGQSIDYMQAYIPMNILMQNAVKLYRAATVAVSKVATKPVCTINVRNFFDLRMMA